MGNRTALITGGSGGIGRACARSLAAEGYDVVLTARGADRLQQVAAELGVEAVAADCADEEGVVPVVEARPQWDLIVHSAGILTGSEVSDQPVETFDELYRSLLRSTYIVVRQALPRMRPGSRVILMSSTAGLRPMKGLSGYSSFKAGMVAFAESLELEVQSRGIAVHVIAPGPVDTPMLRRKWHTLEPDDIAQAVLFLDRLRPGVVLPRFEMRAATEGPFTSDLVGGDRGVGDTGRPD